MEPFFIHTWTWCPCDIPYLESRSACLAALHDGAHTTWDFPINLRVVIVERTRCVPHKKHDMEEETEFGTVANGEPLTLDW